MSCFADPCELRLQFAANTSSFTHHSMPFHHRAWLDSRLIRLPTTSALVLRLAYISLSSQNRSLCLRWLCRTMTIGCVGRVRRTKQCTAYRLGCSALGSNSLVDRKHCIACNFRGRSFCRFGTCAASALPYLCRYAGTLSFPTYQRMSRTRPTTGDA